MDSLELSRIKLCTVTAYSPTRRECDDTPFITANNNKVKAGIVAVSRNLFENGWTFGRRVWIERHGIFVIDDLMAKQWLNRIDVFMWDAKKAKRFGKKKVKVVLLN